MAIVRAHYLYKVRWSLTTELLYSKNPSNTTVTGTLECRYRKFSGVDPLGITIISSRGTSNTLTQFTVGAAGVTYGISIPSATRSNATVWTWVIEITDLEILSDGTWQASLLQVKDGSGTVHYSKTNPQYWDGMTSFGAASIGSIGYGPELRVQVGGGLDSAGASQEADIDAEVRGGFDFKITSSDSWTTLPTTIVNPPTTFPAPSTVPKPYNLTLGTYYSATNSANLRAWTHYDTQISNTSNGAGGWLFVDSTTHLRTGTIALADNTHPSLIRGNSDFATRLRRSYVPKVEGMGQAFTLDRDNYLAYNVGQAGPTTYNTVLNELAADEADIDSTHGAIEADYLSRDHPCLCSALISTTYRKMYRETLSSPYQPTIWTSETLRWDYPYRVWDSEHKPHSAYMQHVLARWDHYTIPAATPTYAGRTQPIVWGQNHRMFKNSDDYYGRVLLGEVESRQPGITFTHGSSYASNPTASYTNASGSLITVPPGGARTLSSTQISVTAGKEVRFLFASLAGPPYLYGLLADTITVPVVSGTGLRFWLEDYSGLKIEVTPSAGVITIPSTPEPSVSYQAGHRDWARGMVDSSGYPAPADVYPDVAANGISSQVYTANRLVQSERRFDGGWYRLTVTCESATMTLGYPTFSRSSTVRNHWMSPDDQIWGTGNRWAKLRASFDSLTTLTKQDPGLPIRIGDWLVWKRAALQGTQPTSALLNADVAGFNAPTEGQTFSAVMGMDQFSYPRVFWNAGSNNAVLIPGWRQNQMHPNLKFSPLDSSLARMSTGATSDRVEIARLGGKLFGYGDYPQLLNSAGTQISTDVSQDGNLYIAEYEGPYPYSSHNVAPNHKLMLRDVHLANVRPCFGYDAFTRQIEQYGLHLCRHSNGFIYSAIADGNSLDCAEMNLSGHYDRWTIAEIPARHAQIAAGPQAGSLVISYELDDDVVVAQSFDYGRTIGDDELITGAEAPAIAVDPLSGIQYVAAWQGGSYKCWAKYTSSWVLRGTIVATEDKGAGLEVSAEASNGLVFVCMKEGDVKRYESYDQGATWALA